MTNSNSDSETQIKLCGDNLLPIRMNAAIAQSMQLENAGLERLGMELNATVPLEQVRKSLDFALIKFRIGYLCCRFPDLQRNRNCETDVEKIIWLMHVQHLLLPLTETLDK